MVITVGSLVLGMVSFDNFRDRLYLAAMLLGFLTIFAGVEYIARRIDK